MITVTADVPGVCPHCGHEDSRWPLRSYLGQVVAVCPECHTSIGQVYAAGAS